MTALELVRGGADFANGPFVRERYKLGQLGDLEGAWLRKGALVMNMADYEVDNDCVRRAGKCVVDYWDNVKHRMISTIALMWRDGLFRDEDLHAEIGEILAGKKPGREDDDEIIYFNAVGAGIMDIAVATRCYKAARQAGKGIELPFWE